MGQTDSARKMQASKYTYVLLQKLRESFRSILECGAQLILHFA